MQACTTRDVTESLKQTSKMPTNPAPTSQAVTILRKKKEKDTRDAEIYLSFSLLLHRLFARSRSRYISHSLSLFLALSRSLCTVFILNTPEVQL